MAGAPVGAHGPEGVAMTRRAIVQFFLLGLGCGLVLAAGDAAAVVIAPGDLIVVDVVAFGDVGTVFRINPVRGMVAIAAGGPGAKLSFPVGLAIAPAGDLYVAERNAAVAVRAASSGSILPPASRPWSPRAETSSIPSGLP